MKFYSKWVLVPNLEGENFHSQSFFLYSGITDKGLWTRNSPSLLQSHLILSYSNPSCILLPHCFLKCNPAIKGIYSLTPISQSPPNTLHSAHIGPLLVTQTSPKLPLFMKSSQLKTPPPQTSIHSSWHIFNATFLFISPSGYDHGVWHSTFITLLCSLNISYFPKVYWQRWWSNSFFGFHFSFFFLISWDKC